MTESDKQAWAEAWRSSGACAELIVHRLPAEVVEYMVEKGLITNEELLVLARRFNKHDDTRKDA